MTSKANTTAGAATVRGRFLHLIYGPHGDIEGALIEVAASPLQLVFDREDELSGALFERIEVGQQISVMAQLQGPSPKGGGVHPVYAHVELLMVDGKRPRQPAPTSGAAYQGRVARLNYARHGVANGVVLDSGDFIHLKPDGMARLRLKVGDEVQADGDAQRLVDDRGWAVEAQEVNGKDMTPPKAR